MIKTYSFSLLSLFRIWHSDVLFRILCCNILIFLSTDKRGRDTNTVKKRPRYVIFKDNALDERITVISTVIILVAQNLMRVR